MRRGFQLITKTIRNLDKPTIASVNGACTGGGMDLALACDLRIGSDRARFQVAFVKRGVMPYTGSTYFLPRVVGLGKALEMLYTGDFVDGQEAERYGLLNRLVPHDDLEEATRELATKLAKGPPIPLRLGKMMMVRGLELDFETSLEMAAAVNVIPQLTEDFDEGRRAFQEKREPEFKGR
jgi:2-(1,2-epoxy-1,2-dihydrophenyl)acetyl-CoA isomerase